MVTTFSCEPDHPLVSGLADAAKSGRFADVKLVCADGVFWSHRVLLASVSPFLKGVLLSADLQDESVLTLHLASVRRGHLALVLDYLYTGAMYLTAENLTGVLRVIEVLRMKCGVSVSKMVQHSSVASDDEWVEEAKFGGLDHLTMKQEIKEDFEDEEDLFAQKHQNVFLDSWEKPIEVRPISEVEERRAERRISRDYMPVQVIEESDSDDDDQDIFEDVDEDESLLAEAKDATEQADWSNGGANHKCVMCGKVFRHEVNLKVHIRGHLGASAVLHSCQICKRTFRSSLELELHSNSHKFSRFRELRANKQRIATNDGGLRKKLLKKSLKSIRKLVAKEERLLPDASREAYRSKVEADATRKSSRTMRRSAKMEEVVEAAAAVARATMPKPPEQTFKLKMKVKLPPQVAKAAPVIITAAPKKAAARQRKPSVAKKPEDDLTCETCDKTFPSRSIYERHLKTYRHGVYVQSTLMPAQQPPHSYMPHALPHFNKVLQPTMELGGREVNKYECHLCSKVFLRVKDLAKHREKTCSAWFEASK